MFTRLLSDTEKDILIDLSRLISIADKPLLWDGVTKNELKSENDIKKLSILEGEKEQEIISGLLSLTDSKTYRFSPTKSMLIDNLKSFPISQIEKPEIRLQAARAALKETLDGKKLESPSAAKAILFELIFLALADGIISNIEWELLKDNRQHHKQEDIIFKDILKCAEILDKEIKRTTSIILE